MATPLKPPPIAEVVRTSVAYAARAREHLRAGLSDARIASLEPPGADEHLRRFFFGFALPLTLMRIAWSNLEIRASVVRRLVPPLLFVGLVATVGTVGIVRAVARARQAPPKIASHGDGWNEREKGDAHEDRKDRDSDDGDDDDDAVDGVAVARAVEDAKENGGSALAISAAALEATREPLKGSNARPSADPRATAPPASPPARSSLGATLDAIWRVLTSKVAKLVATLSVIEWILVWIGREHHDQIAYETAVLTGVPGEPLPAPPRLRFDIAWLKIKGWRALRLLLFFSLAAPVVGLVGMVPRVGGALAVVVEAAWASYWACVFAIANTFLVWEHVDHGDRAPWFMRVLAAAGRVPVLGLPFRLYAWALRVATRNVWPACLAFERTTWESAGLALARTIASAPVVYILTRPAFVPASTHAFLARMNESRATEPPPLPA
jgi:hypothetical protein